MPQQGSSTTTFSSAKPRGQPGVNQKPADGHARDGKEVVPLGDVEEAHDGED